MAEENTDCPMHAKAVGRHVRLTLFGWVVMVEQPSNEEAVSATNRWNGMLGKEWQTIRETSATLVQAYTEALMGQGVSRDIVDKALREVQANGE